jgi:hypothetical protein
MENLPMPCPLKTAVAFLPTSWLHSCLHETAEGTDEHHTPQLAPLPTLSPHPTPQENTPAQSLCRLNPLQQN